MNWRCLLAFEHDLLHLKSRFRTYRIHRIDILKPATLFTFLLTWLRSNEKVLNVKVKILRERQNYLCTWHLTWKSYSILVSQKRVPRRESSQEDCVPKRRSYIPVERKNKIDKERRIFSEENLGQENQRAFYGIMKTVKDHALAIHWSYLREVIEVAFKAKFDFIWNFKGIQLSMENTGIYLWPSSV